MAEITNIACRRLHPHPDNPRKELGDLTELAASIRENGIFQNLTVIPGHYMTAEEYADSVAADGGSRQSAMAVWNPKIMWSSDDYTIIIGHRRAAAAQQAGLFEVPCVVVEMDEREQLQTMMIENMQRTDLTTYEQALRDGTYKIFREYGSDEKKWSDCDYCKAAHPNCDKCCKACDEPCNAVQDCKKNEERTENDE